MIWKRLRLYADRDQHGRIRTTYLVRQGPALSLAFADSDTDTVVGAVAAPPATPNNARIAARTTDDWPCLSYLALRVVFGRYGRPQIPPSGPGPAYRPAMTWMISRCR